MIHVLIAEDEPPTLRRISEMVERLDPAFCVAATALNGQEALQKLSETPIDLVLTDIRMPVMDGLQLMNEIRRNYPSCMVVVLSGYQDYEYMSHAIRTHSLDYLLKPVSDKALCEMLARVKTQYLELGRERLSRSLSVRLNKAAPGEHSEADAKVGVCLFCAGSMPLTDDAEMYPGVDAWVGNSLELLAAEIVPDFVSFRWEFMGDTPAERILIFQAQDVEFNPWVKYLHEALLSGANLPISCAFTESTVPLRQVRDVLKALRNTLRRHIRIGHSAFVCLSEPEPSDDPPIDRESACKLADLFTSGRIAQPDTFCHQLFVRMEREQWPQDRVARLLMDATTEMERDVRPEVQERARFYKKVLCDAACTALSIQELERNVCSLEVPEASDDRGSTSRHRDLADAIEQYLRTNYTSHITTQTIGQVFGYVPSYASLLFRQVYQLSPSEYLTQIRIREAKALMKAHPNMLIREVAMQVGFKSQHHFSHTFKKYEGVWPTSYLS